MLNISAACRLSRRQALSPLDKTSAPNRSHEIPFEQSSKYYPNIVNVPSASTFLYFLNYQKFLSQISIRFIYMYSQVLREACDLTA